MQNKAFTLIELLVVISIISLLSTVVMASINQSRVKAQEATIKQTLQSIRTQAELEYSKTGDYSTLKTAIAPMLKYINSNGGTASTTYSNIYPINESYKRYAVSVKLNSDSNKNWFVSSETSSFNEWGNSDSNNGQPTNWNNAKNICANVGGRLPSAEELKSLRNLYNSSPPSFYPDYYWSNNYAGPYSNALTVSMYNGGIGAQSQSNLNLVRCIK